MNMSSDRNEDQPDLGRRRFVHQAGAGALATGAAGKSLALLLSGSVFASKNKAPSDHWNLSLNFSWDRLRHKKI
jgi:hypothetical protein